MHYLFKEYLDKFSKQNSWETNSPQNNKAAIIIETRPVWQLVPVIRNFMSFCADFNFYFIGSDETITHVKNNIHGIQYFNIPNKQPFFPFYNKLLSSEKFWNQFYEDDILVFQSDSIMLRPIDKRFFDYDMVGALCGNLNQFTMNGGCSLRKRNMMIECIKMHPNVKNINEDIHFTESLRKMITNLPTAEECQRFSVESVPTKEKPCVIHGITNNWLTTEEVKNYL